MVITATPRSTSRAVPYRKRRGPLTFVATTPPMVVVVVTGGSRARNCPRSPSMRCSSTKRIPADQAVQALAYLPRDADTRVLGIELRLALGYPLPQLGEHRLRLDLLGEAEVLARALDDRVRLARALTGMAFVRWVTGDLAGAM